MHEMSMPSSPLGVPHSRIGSGTSWLPDSSRMRELSVMKGQWMISLHGSFTGFYDQQNTQRGDTSFGETDWEMVMAMRPLAGGLFHLHAMTSLEPLLLGAAGYPLLLQTGGSYQHSFIHDRQHPHQGLMEAAAMYEHSLGSSLAWSTYLAAAGEPALGPPAFMHRPSAENDPFAPLGHHWQDAAHESYGVATLGLFTHSLKLEGSAFNPREPDEHYPFADYRQAKLDSYTGRLNWAPTAHLVASSWWAYLNSHDRLDPDTRMHRYGASLLTDMNGIGGGRWSSTFIWAMNVHHHGAGAHEFLHGTPGASPHHHSSSILGETNFEVGSKTAVFARIEGVRKSGEELGFQGGDLTVVYDIRSYVLGASRTLLRYKKAELIAGARGSIDFVTEDLHLAYGTRRPTGFAIFANVRPVR